MRGAQEGLAPELARRHRTIFISDVHLGTPGCKADLLADFLTTTIAAPSISSAISSISGGSSAVGSEVRRITV